MINLLGWYLIINYAFLRAAFSADNRKTMKNAIITGEKTSSQPMPPVIIFSIKRMELNTNPNEIRTCFIPVVRLFLLFATRDIFNC